MIISSLLKEILQPMTITYAGYNSYKELKASETKSVRFGYGDKHELERFIAKNRNTQNQFPLIWYNMGDYERDDHDLNKFDLSCNLILMTSTSVDLYNEERNLYNYSTVLNKLAIDVLSKLQLAKNVDYVGKSRENTFPNDGINDQSETPLVYVDALSLEFQLIIKTKCNG
jgi:hypothetical protein